MKKNLLLCIAFIVFRYSSAQTGLFNVVSISNPPSNDQSPSLTSLFLSNRGLGGGSYTWSLYTAAVGGGYGVKPNAFEIWLNS